MQQSFKVDDSLKFMLLFEATFTASLFIKDSTVKQYVKFIFNKWFNESRKLKKALLVDVSTDLKRDYDYEEMAANLYDIASLSLQAWDKEKLIEVIKKEIERQNTI